MKTDTEGNDRWRHLADPRKNWQIDYSNENGNYSNKCYKCGSVFVGNKGRFICRECVETIDEKANL